jgi:hypothetical protein
MGLVFSILLCLAVGETPEPWEDLLDREHLSQWTGLKNSVRKLDDGVMEIELATSMNSLQPRYERTLAYYELSYEFLVDEGAVHVLWYEFPNGLLRIRNTFAGKNISKDSSCVTPGVWHRVQFVRRDTNLVTRLDDKPYPDERTSSSRNGSARALMLQVETGKVRIRNVRLLDLTTAFRRGARPAWNDGRVLDLKGLPHLQEIDLSGSEVTDRGLAHLVNFKMLRRVDVRDTKVTADGIAELKKHLPECEIIR